MKTILIVAPRCSVSKCVQENLIKGLRTRGFDAFILNVWSPPGAQVQVFNLDSLTPLELDEVRSLIEEKTKA